MVMTATEEHTTDAALPAIFDMQQFMTLEVLTCRKSSVTDVTWKGGVMDMLVFSEICKTGEVLFTNVAEKGPFFMLMFVF